MDDLPINQPGRVAGMKKRSGMDDFLDNAQTGLSIAGMVPGLGAAPDLINAGVSALRGDWGGAALNAVSAIPFLGDAIGGGKLVGQAAKATKML